MSLLNEIQQHLKAPKGQYNAFGKYKYRNAEDILEAVKPHLGKGTLIISDEMVQIGERFYVKATATLSDGKETWAASAFARESLDKKGMDEAQITGAASSYARKYALNGLFCIDDTKDADSDETPKKMESYQVARKVPPSDDEAGGNTQKTEQFLEQDEINAVLKEEIKDLLISLGHKKPTKKIVHEVSGLPMEEDNYKHIRNILRTKLEATDPLETIIQD